MRIAALQHDIPSDCPAENRQRLAEMIAQHPGADVYVMSEMFDTGFLAGTPDGKALAWLQQQARATGAAMVASTTHSDDAEGGLPTNRLWFVRPDGTATHYDKRHLFTYAGEDLSYAPGQQRVVVSHLGVRILLQVCYDLRFPVFSRNLGDYDAIVYVANWPATRIEAWRTLLRARAIENQCYVVGVNRIGDDRRCHYSGASAIVDPRGRLLAEGPQETSSCLIADIDLAALSAFRQKFPVLNDRDDFQLKI